MGRAEEIFEKVKQEGERAIDEFILIRQSEELFLDFKCSADDGRGPRKLHDHDRNNLAKAISGFGNSEGGVIVWGVDARPGVDYADVAQAKKPIENVTRFVSWLEGTVSGRTVPAHGQVKHHPIDIGNGNGFVVTLIPLSELAPHQCLFDSKYYMRAGSNFVPVPHSVLAGMFGRRPQPVLIRKFMIYPTNVSKFRPEEERGTQVEVSLYFVIVNRGPVLARDLYSDLRIIVPRTKCQASFVAMSEDWTHRKEVGAWIASVSKPHFRLGPESFTNVFRLHLLLERPFIDGKFFLRWTCGCDGAPVLVMEVEHNLADIERLHRQVVADSNENKHEEGFIKELLKLPSDQIFRHGQDFSK